MFKYYCALLLLISSFWGYSQTQTKDSTLSLNDLEALFLANNYQLLSAKYNIDKADAQIIQAKLWHNPTLTLSQVNFWSNKTVQTQPYLFGHTGDKQEFAFDLQQVIETAGKRKKRADVETTGKNIAQLDFEVLVRELRLKLRSSYYELQRISEVRSQLNNFVEYYTNLASSYKRQVDLQAISVAQYYRIQTELLNNKQQLINLISEEADAIQNLRILTQLPTLQLENIKFDTLVSPSLTQRIPSNILQIAADSSYTKRYIKQQLLRSEQLITLEKANAKPDVQVLASYDRGGNIMSNFVGFGIGIDLPFYNRNQGNIKIAQLELEQNKLQSNTLDLTLNTQVEKLEKELEQYELILKEFPTSSFDNFKKIMDNYLKHVQDQQISLVEMIDYAQAYLQARENYYEILKNYQVTFQELQLLIGKDL